MQNQPSSRFHTAPVYVDWEGNPAAIVAVHDGEPIVLTVSEKTLNLFKRTQENLGLSSVALANMLYKKVCHGGGQFHEMAVIYALQHRDLS